MVFVSLAWIAAGLIWLAVIVRRIGAYEFRIPFTLLGFFVIVSGSVLGYELFHVPAPIPITSDRALLAIIVACFGILLLRRKQTLNNLVMLDIVAIALLALIVASAATHDWRYSNNLPISRFLFFYLMPVSLYFVVRNANSSDSELKFISVAMVVFGCYLAATGIFEVKDLHTFVFPKYILNPGVTEFLGRARGPFINPISNGIFLTASLAFAVVLLGRAKQMKFQILLGAVVGLLVIGNIATLTRSVWLGMGLGIGIVVWCVTNRKQKAVMLIGGTFAALFLVSFLGSNLINFKRDKHVTRTEMAQSAKLRPIFAIIAWEMFQDRPIFGHGFGQYNNSKIPYLQKPTSGFELAKAKPYLQHNVLLSLLTELGAIGCGILIILVVRSYQISIQILSYHGSTPTAKMYALVLIALLTTYITNGMFHDTSIIPMANMLLFFVLGIVVRSHQQLGLSTDVLQLTRAEHASLPQDLDLARS